MVRMPSASAAAASRACRAASRSGAMGNEAARSTGWSDVVIGCLPGWRHRRAERWPAGGGDAIGAGPAGRVGGAAEDGGDLSVRQAGQVVIRDGLLLFGRQLGQRRDQARIDVIAVRCGGFLRKMLDRDGAPGG